MNLDAYFKRIGFAGAARPDLTTLNMLHEAHLRALPFENLDVFAGRRVSMNAEGAFEKIVVRGRGGWCFEMNTLFEWVLCEIGFDVRRLTAGVRRWQRGDIALGNHLALLVRLDQDYLVDVGFGSWQMHAMPLVKQMSRHPPIEMALSKTNDGYWRLHEGGPGAAHGYDFKLDGHDEVLLSAGHDAFVSGDDSKFRKNLLAMCRKGRDIYMLRGKVLTKLRPGGKDMFEARSPDELRVMLANVFSLEEPDLESLWPKICARHARLFPQSN